MSTSGRKGHGGAGEMVEEQQQATDYWCAVSQRSEIGESDKCLFAGRIKAKRAAARKTWGGQGAMESLCAGGQKEKTRFGMSG